MCSASFAAELRRQPLWITRAQSTSGLRARVWFSEPCCKLVGHTILRPLVQYAFSLSDCLHIPPSVPHKRPFSKRANECIRQTMLLKNAWHDSGKVYGYRKLHDDLRDQGETCCPNRVARLARLAGVKAQIGYKRRSDRYGGRPTSRCFIIRSANTLETVCCHRHTLNGTTN
ncbi:hypothetical protein FHW16_002645 [Phyllobacterium myrsinacearum]|uniref:HTH-like domain-containing protein n=1 Tax=Phyllobacterium myrsinacearum TaxID=28101 RepID=A0A839ER50_9HYPH|nr:hypothetical protein [Phyllobacterium myrsinacearum]